MYRVTKDDIGSIYGCYKIIRIAKDKISPSGKIKKYYLCKCIICGNEAEINAYKLRHNSYSHCKNCRPKQRNIKNMIGKRFNNLTIIARAPNNIQPNGSSKVMWLCKCDCGNIIKVADCHLKSGHTRSCGCINSGKTKKDLLDMQFGKLKVIKCLGVKNHRTFWGCRCECGKYVEVSTTQLTTGKVKSCGCLYSVAEYEVSKFLDNENILYSNQYTFEDCRNINKLPFDFAIFNPIDKSLMFLIELNGEQHYYPFTFNGEGKEIQKQNLLNRQKLDQIKISYCEKNEIPLLIIKYTNFNVKEQIIDKFYNDCLLNGVRNNQFIYKSKDIKNKYLIKNKKVSKRPVIQIDIQAKEIINKYESISEASKQTNLLSGQISDCCKRKYKTSGGYAWAYDDENFNIDEIISFASQPNKKRHRIIIQKNMQGEIVKEWFSISEAANAYHVKYQNIQRCCAGKQKSSCGYLWEYK